MLCICVGLGVALDKSEERDDIEAVSCRSAARREGRMVVVLLDPLVSDTAVFAGKAETSSSTVEREAGPATIDAAVETD